MRTIIPTTEGTLPLLPDPIPSGEPTDPSVGEPVAHEADISVPSRAFPAPIPQPQLHTICRCGRRNGLLKKNQSGQ